MPLGALAFALAAAIISPAGAEVTEGRVTHVGDGDSLSICVAQRELRVRLVNIDAPEYRQPFGLESRQSLVDLCDNRQARVYWAKKDTYGRALGQVWCDGRDANAEQVRRGLAWVSRLDAPDESFYAAQKAARAARLGLWADDNPEPPWRWRRRNATRSNWKGVGERSC